MQEGAVHPPNGVAVRWARSWSLRVQCGATGLVALGAAYASYQHGRVFALRFGADATTAAIWPLIVDGLLTLATVELWRGQRGSGRWLAWAAFLFGISLSLCANIGAAPSLSVFGVTVAACPPLALLLAVELLNRALRRHWPTAADPSPHAEPGRPSVEAEAVVEPMPEAAQVDHELTAEQRMWLHYEQEAALGRRPSGAELDRVAGTHNYGRRVLRRWRAEGRLDAMATVDEKVDGAMSRSS
ncbi:DUF2637 domain-containing protein [Amycolatopsis sp. FU40]|uniref:DUF2637 domain-containing protein n=1 Tax=Amycolatopsis sp. FU40 TaxID=2914159 RepID=UPI002715543C|nr:DUF2637 domain-containing protein [Amycolatopsis sp. FU40]